MLERFEVQEVSLCLDSPPYTPPRPPANFVTTTSELITSLRMCWDDDMLSTLSLGGH